MDDSKEMWLHPVTIAAILSVGNDKQEQTVGMADAVDILLSTHMHLHPHFLAIDNSRKQTESK